MTFIRKKNKTTNATCKFNDLRYLFPLTRNFPVWPAGRRRCWRPKVGTAMIHHPPWVIMSLAPHTNNSDVVILFSTICLCMIHT